MTTVHLTIELDSQEYTWASHAIKSTNPDIKNGLSEMLGKHGSISIINKDLLKLVPGGKHIKMDIPVELNQLTDITERAKEHDLEVNDYVRLIINYLTQDLLEEKKQNEVKEKLEREMRVGKHVRFHLAGEDFAKFIDIFGRYNYNTGTDVKRFNDDVYKVFKRGLEAIEE